MAAVFVCVGAASAQVAGSVNAGYQTPAQREAMAANLGNPERNQSQKPEQLVAFMGLQPGMTVADVGTGPGYMLPYLSRAVGAGGHVIAEDVFDEFLADARRRAQTGKLTNVEFVKGTASDPHLPAGRLDRILVLDAYHHFDHPQEMLAALHQSLKATGKLIVVEYYKRPEALGGRAVTHIRLDMPDLIKEIESNHFHLVMERETIPHVQYMLVLERD